MRWQSVALTPVLLLLLVSAGLSQEKSCVELCRLDPQNVPPGCVCAVAADGSGVATASSRSPLEMTARELLEWEQAYYAERMAPIDNYWVVVKSNISPIAEVRYFEKEGTADGDLPYFRMVPPSELAQRETLASPDAGPAERMAAENPAALMDAYAQALDAIASNPEVNAETGGAASGLLGVLADGFRDVGIGIEEQEEQRREDEMEDLDNLFDDIIGWSNNMRSTLELALYYPDRQTPAQRFGDPFPVSPSSPQISPGLSLDDWVEEMEEDGETIVCGVTKLNVPFDYENPDGTTYTIEHAERWYGKYATVYVRIEVRAVTAAGFQRAVMERETDRYRDDGPLIPHRTRQRFSGALMEVVEEVKHLQSNTGPPSQVEIAQHTVGTMGVPGADPPTSP
jgi:hypothetical protein